MHADMYDACLLLGGVNMYSKVSNRVVTLYIAANIFLKLK